MISQTIDSCQTDLPTDQHTDQSTDQTRSSFTVALSGGWCTIESDLGMLTNLFKCLGVRGVDTTELWSLDNKSLRSLISNQIEFTSSSSSSSAMQATMIIVSKRTIQGDPTTVRVEDVPPGLFYTRQVNHNACASQAMILILLNSEGVVEGEKVVEIKSRERETTAAKPPPLSLVSYPLLG